MDWRFLQAREQWEEVRELLDRWCSLVVMQWLWCDPGSGELKRPGRESPGGWSQMTNNWRGGLGLQVHLTPVAQSTMVPEPYQLQHLEGTRP